VKKVKLSLVYVSFKMST